VIGKAGEVGFWAAIHTCADGYLLYNSSGDIMICMIFLPAAILVITLLL